MLRFGGIVSLERKKRGLCSGGGTLLFVHFEHHFRQFLSVYIINANFSIKKVHLHVETILRRYHSLVYVHWFGRDARTKPFLRLSFIYIEINTARY